MAWADGNGWVSSAQAGAATGELGERPGYSAAAWVGGLTLGERLGWLAGKSGGTVVATSDGDYGGDGLTAGGG